MSYLGNSGTEGYSHSTNESFAVDDSESGRAAGYAKGPERTLMLAILFDGLQSYISFTCAKSAQAKARHREAFNWVHSDEREYIFSFVGVCEGLGIDPDFLRVGLSGASELRAEGHKRSRRHF